VPRQILLVDDDAEVRLAVDRQLSDLGWETVVVNSGEDAMRLVAEQVRVDVLLTELELPDMDGRDLAWAVCQKQPFVRVAFMSRDAPAGPEPGNAPFLRKPFTAAALSNALADARPLRRVR
jgi:two-component system cell cycle sensor histidine kinase/response regulator CckA